MEDRRTGPGERLARGARFVASRPVRPRPSGFDRTGRGRFGGARHSGVGSKPPAHPRRPARPAVAAAALSNAVPGAPGEIEHAVAFRARLVATLRTRRAAGEIEADVDPALEGIEHEAAVEAVRESAALLPRTWIERANRTGLAVKNNHEKSGGQYYETGQVDYHHDGKDRALAVVPDPSLSRSGTDLHEYVHHIQRAMPGLDELFRGLHRARTAGDPVVQLPRYRAGVTGRDDRYIDPYIGREYDGEPREVITKTYQILLRDQRKLRGTHVLARMLRDDPELADLAIGALMRYDP